MVNIINEQLKIAIDYWTKVLTESEDYDRRKQATFDFKQAIINKTIDVNNLRIVFNCNFNVKLFSTLSAKYTAVLNDLRITDFYNEYGICVCDEESNGSNSKAIALQIAFSTSALLIFLMKSAGEYEKAHYIFAYIDRIENNIIYLDFVSGEDVFSSQELDAIKQKYIIDMFCPGIAYDFIKEIEFHDNDTHSLHTISSPAGKNTVAVTIDEGIESICSEVFAKCSKLATLKLPSTLTHIYNSAFEESGLLSLEIPDSVCSIGNFAFDNSRLEHVKMPRRLIRLDSSAFASSPLQEMTLYVNFSAKSSYYYVTRMFKLKTLIVENGCLPHIEYNQSLFLVYDCPNLETIYFNEDVFLDDQLFVIKYVNDKMFLNCGNLKTIYVQSEKCKNNIEKHFKNYNKEQTQIIVRS